MQYFQSRLVAEWLGLEQAGLYWVAWTLSMSYVTLLLGSFGSYYMPALSALEHAPARQALIRDYLRLTLIVMPVIVSLVILFKPWVVLLMFSPKLIPALNVMRWMLIGDLFKGVAWVLSFPMLAFNEMRWFFWTEVAFNVGLAGASLVALAAGGGIESLGLLFALWYAAYLLLMWGYIRHKHHFELRRSELARFLAGLGLVLGSSVATWNASNVRLSHVLMVLTASGVFAFVELPRALRRARVAAAP
jgi:PST family polysaccharide transporter